MLSALISPIFSVHTDFIFKPRQAKLFKFQIEKPLVAFFYFQMILLEKAVNAEKSKDRQMYLAQERALRREIRAVSRSAVTSTAPGAASPSKPSVPKQPVLAVPDLDTTMEPDGDTVGNAMLESRSQHVSYEEPPETAFTRLSTPFSPGSATAYKLPSPNNSPKSSSIQVTLRKI